MSNDMSSSAKKMQSALTRTGRYVFIAGLVISLVAGFGLYDKTWVPWVLAVLGLIVGFLNVEENETQVFLLAGIALLFSASAFSGVPHLGDTVTNIAGYLEAFISGAVLVVALKTLFESGKS